MIADAHSNAIHMAKISKNTLVLGLYESILDTKSLHAYRVPFCFREVDDDLSVDKDEVETPLD